MAGYIASTAIACRTAPTWKRMGACPGAPAPPRLRRAQFPVARVEGRPAVVLLLKGSRHADSPRSTGSWNGHRDPDFTRELPRKLFPTRAKEPRRRRRERRQFTRRCLWRLGSSLDLERAHNPKVAGSNPAPAPTLFTRMKQAHSSVGRESSKPNPGKGFLA